MSKKFASMSPAERKAAIERIVKATGRSPDDADKLVEDICQADDDYSQTLNVKQAEAQRTHRLLKRIRKGMANSAKLIETDPIIKKIADSYELPRLLEALGNFENWQAMRHRAKKNQGKKSRQASAIEWLAGVSLPLVYERRFGAAVVYSRRAGDSVPHGPAVSFIEATLAELGLKYDRHSIGRALTRLRGTRGWYREIRQTLKPR
jgi:hypothetical protein